MTRRLPRVLLAVLMLASGAIGVQTVGAAQTTVAIESVDLSVDQPAPGEPFTLEATVTNFDSSSGPVQVTDIYVREADGGTEYARAEDVGMIAAGSSLTVPLTLSIEDRGTVALTVFVVVRDGDGDFTRVKYPVLVDVEEPDEALITVGDGDLVAGQETALNLTVTNGAAGPLSKVRLELGGNASIDDEVRAAPSIESGARRTFTFPVSFTTPGEHTLNATLTYQTPEGVERTITRTVSVEVEPATVDPELAARAVQVNGSSAIRVSLTEFGNAELREVTVRVMVGDRVVARAILPDVSPEERESVLIDGRNIPAGDVTVVADFVAAGEAGTVEKELAYSPVGPAEIVLASVKVIRQGSTITLRGDAANIGSTAANSVLLTVVGEEAVAPVSSGEEFYIGTVDSSDFGTFQLAANVGRDVDRIEVRISYTTSGEHFTKVVPVDIRYAATPEGAASQSSSNGGSLLPMLGLIGILVAAGVGAYWWRTQ